MTVPEPESGAAILCATGLVKQYKRVRAVDGVSLRVDAGERVGLLGPNGAGKTTLIAHLSGALPLQQGEITLDGEPLAAVPAC